MIDTIIFVLTYLFLKAKLNMFKYCSKKENVMKHQDARQMILQAASDLIEEVDDPEAITVRQVADRAKVGTGLINYHFTSKNNLLSVVVANKMAKMAFSLLTFEKISELNPSDKLKTILKELFSYAQKHEKLVRFTITQNLLQGEMKTPLFLIPVLQEIFGEDKSEMQLRIIALQILFPIQIASLNPDEFLLYSGIDLYDTKQRNEYIEILADNVIHM